MTDRVNSFLVVLEKDMRTDDAEAVITALRMIRGVIAVEPQISSVDSSMAEWRARNDLRQKLRDVLNDSK